MHPKNVGQCIVKGHALIVTKSINRSLGLNMKNCPTCQSDQFKKATLLHAEGQSVTVGGVVGVGPGGIGLGAGRGVTKSVLANTCAPPKRPPSSPMGDAKLWQIFVVAIPLFIAFRNGTNFSGVDYLWLLFGGAGAVYLFSKGAKAETQIRARHAEELEKYEKTYMCLRCGALSQPFE